MNPLSPLSTALKTSVESPYPPPKPPDPRSKTLPLSPASFPKYSENAKSIAIVIRTGDSPDRSDDPNLSRMKSSIASSPIPLSTAIFRTSRAIPISPWKPSASNCHEFSAARLHMSTRDNDVSSRQTPVCNPGSTPRIFITSSYTLPYLHAYYHMPTTTPTFRSNTPRTLTTPTNNLQHPPISSDVQAHPQNAPHTSRQLTLTRSRALSLAGGLFLEVAPNQTARTSHLMN